MKKNILIIDDDKRLRELLEEYLSEKEYKVFLSDDFSSGKEILEYFMEADSDRIQLALDEFDGDYDDEELRLMRIKFISEVAN